MAIGGVSILGTGALAIAALVVGNRAWGNANDGLCDALTGTCGPKGNGLRNQAHALQSAEIALGGVGVLGLVTGGILFAKAPRAPQAGIAVRLSTRAVSIAISF
jgi:hypothetical protein